MRVFARKQREPLTMVPRKTTQQRGAFEVNPSGLQESFHGWLHSVAVISDEPMLPAPAVNRVPRLTALDVSRVNHATIREGESHCIWPPSVIRKFNKADVITSSKVTHYELTDANLTRVENKKRTPSSVRSAVVQMLAERD